MSAPPRRALRAGNFRISGCGLPKMEDPRSIMRSPPVLLAQNRTTTPKSCKFTHFPRPRAPPSATTPLPDPRARKPLPRKGFSPSGPPEFRRRATKPLPGNAAAPCAARKINFPKGIRYPPNCTISSVFRQEPLPNQQVLQLLTRFRILPATAGRTRFCGKSPPERWKFMKGE